jgi:hypothetical protein
MNKEMSFDFIFSKNRVFRITVLISFQTLCRHHFTSANYLSAATYAETKNIYPHWMLIRQANVRIFRDFATCEIRTDYKLLCLKISRRNLNPPFRL